MSKSSAVKGWNFSHIGLRVSDLDRSLELYTTILGMKELSRLEFDTVRIALVGYSHGKDDQIFNREGLLELVQNKNSKNIITNSDAHPGFGLVKLCFTVPDLSKAMAYVKAKGLKVLKDVGTQENTNVVSTALGCDGPETGRNKALWDLVEGIGFFEDPDGYLVELVPYDVSDSSSESSSDPVAKL